MQAKVKIFFAVWISGGNWYNLAVNSSNMSKKKAKGTNKAKFSLYLDKTIMANAAKEANKLDRSINYIVEKSLEKDFA